MERAGFHSYQPSLTQETGLSLPTESGGSSLSR
jgi:hypothetical protein